MAELKQGGVSTVHHHVMRESFSVEMKLKLRWRRMWGSQPRRGRKAGCWRGAGRRGQEEQAPHGGFSGRGGGRSEKTLRRALGISLVPGRSLDFIVR